MKMEKFRNPLFNIMANKKIFFAISAVVVAISVLSMIIFGFNLDTDFAGGTTLTVSTGKTVSVSELDDVAELVNRTLGFRASSIQRGGINNADIVIKTLDLSEEQSGELWEAVKAKYSLTDEDRQLDNVSPTMSADLARSAVIAVTVAIVLMLIYIIFRFKSVASGLAAVTCLVHDVLIMFLVYSVFRLNMSMTMIAAALTILGYSINATIIVFDRVRENRRKGGGNNFEETIEKSIWQTAVRSLNTTITTLIMIGLIMALGVTSVRELAIPLVVGILAGLYSSMLLAGPLWYTIQNIIDRISLSRSKGKAKKA